jgi:hypothetical protein
MTTPSKRKPKDKVLLEWRAKYGKLVAGPLSVVCDVCGATLMGDGHSIPVVCLECWRKGNR